MAEIKTAISIIDNMTPVLRSMNSALSVIIRDYENLQTATKEMATAQQELNSQFKSGESFMGRMAGRMGGMVAAYASMQSVLGLAGAADDYINIGSRLDLINDGLQTTEELQEMVRASANATYSSYKDTADMVGKLGIQAGSAFKNNQDILNFAEQINKHIAIAGTSGAAAQGAMIQMTQAMSNGVLRGEELNSVLDGMPTVAKAIEKYFHDMGDTRGIKAIAEEGKITAEIVKQALYTAADDTNKKFEQMGVTFLDVWNLFKNQADKAMKPVYKRLGELTNNVEFQNLLISAGNSVAVLANSLIWAFDALAKVGQAVVNNWGWVAPVIWTVTAAVTAYNGALLLNYTRQKLTALWTGISIVASKLKAAGTWAETSATIAATAAQWGLNAALLACPITWIVAAIIGLIGVFYLAVAAVNYFAGESISATGIIAGTFNTLAATVYNIIAYLWNLFASIAEFLYNVFVEPSNALIILFANLATNFLSMVISMTSGWDGFATSMANAFITAINTVMKAWNGFIDLLPDKVKNTLGLGKGAEISATTSITGDLNQVRNRLNAMALGAQKDGHANLGRMAMKSTGGAWQEGYKWGSELGSFSLNGLAGGAVASGMANNSASMLANAGIGKTAAADLSKTAANTGKMADSLTANEEDIRLLREIAERDVINRFTTAEIKIDMQNNNSISNSMDIDGVINSLTDKLYDAMTIAAEGVHV